MQILELVHGGEFRHVQTVGQDTIGLALEKMLRLVCSNVGNGGKDIAGVCGGALNAVSVVDTTLSSFRVNVKVLQVVVEIDGTSAQVSPEKSRVGGEDCGHINATLLAEREGDTRKPFVEMGNDCDGLFTSDKLGDGQYEEESSCRGICVPLPKTMQPSIQRRQPRWSPRLLAEKGFPRCSRDLPSTRRETSTRILCQ